MSVFRDIRIFPKHGTRSAAVTWQMAQGTPAGDVYVAFSPTGVKGSWTVRNADTPVPSVTGVYEDDALELNSGAYMGYYRLMLTAGATDYFSEPVAISGDISPKEYGMIRGILHREFMEMRATNGYPVWYCVLKSSGEKAPNVDLDTEELDGIECADVDPSDASYDTKFKGGFYPPVLTWMRALQLERGSLSDSASEAASEETDTVKARFMAWPTPRRGDMVVDPATDRRYLVGDRVETFMFRGVFPVAYEVELQFLTQGDARYRFEMPQLDTRSYRKIQPLSQ